MNRRDLIQKVLLGGTVLFVIPSAMQSCSKDDSNDPGTTSPPAGSTITIDLSLPENAALNTAGGSKVVQTVLVMNISGNYGAVSSICTHQGCTVTYVSGAGNIQCACHGSAFTTSGTVVNGPAASALRSYRVVKSGTVLTITL